MLADPEACAIARLRIRQRLPTEAARGRDASADPKAAAASGTWETRRPHDVSWINSAVDISPGPRLAQVPAYQSFLEELTKALKELNFQ